MSAPPWDVDAEPPDVAILVALDEEFREFLSWLPVGYWPRENTRHAGYDYFWIDPGTGYRCVATSSGRMGPDESTRVAGRLLEWNPAVLVNVGIAASMHGDLRIGDVIVPDMVHAYDKTAKAVPVMHGDVETWDWERRGDAFRPTHKLVERARGLMTVHPARHQAWQATGEREIAEIRVATPDAFRLLEAAEKKVLRTQPELRVVFLGSGNFVGASTAFAAWLRKANADVKALEMEAAGMLLAAEKRFEPTPALVIRGISDHIDAPKTHTDAIAEGALRGLAMRNALRVLGTLMELEALPRHSRHASASASIEPIEYVVCEAPGEVPGEEAGDAETFHAQFRATALMLPASVLTSHSGPSPREVVSSRAAMRSQQALYSLLLELFDDNSALAVFLGFEARDPRLLEATLGTVVSRSEYVFKAVNVLESRGLVDAAFFVRLMAERPGKRTAIASVATAYGIDVHLVSPSSSPVYNAARRTDRARRVFVAYSCRDTEFLRELNTHLAPLRRQGLIDPWTDREIVAGQNWDEVLQRQHACSELYLFLVSADFLATDYCYEIEVQRALERRARNEAATVPIILRPCDWESTPLGAIQVLPERARPITQWENRDAAWSAVVQGLRKVIVSLFRR